MGIPSAEAPAFTGMTEVCNGLAERGGGLWWLKEGDVG